MRWITLAAASVLCAGPVRAGVQAGKIVGKVQICGAGGCAALYEGRPLDQNDVVTVSKGRCDLDADGGSLRALEGAKVRLEDGSPRSCRFSLMQGSALAAWPDGDCVVATPQAEADGAGARYRVALEDGLTHVAVLERGVLVQARARAEGMRRRWWAGKLPPVARVPDNAAAAILMLKGAAQVDSGDEKEHARLGMPLVRGDELQTDSGWAIVAFTGGAIGILDAGSRLAIETHGTGFAVVLRRGRLYMMRRNLRGQAALVVAGATSADGDSDEFEAAASDGQLSDFIVYSGSLFLSAGEPSRASQAAR